MNMWRSKLGKEYEKAFIEANELKYKAQLDQIRKQPENKTCADCETEGTVWASVNLGVFLCLRCGSAHRGLGTHISVPKGCTGTYLWGPDEIEQMRCRGNAAARQYYGGDKQRPGPSASDEAWREFIRDKYEHQKWVQPVPSTPAGDSNRSKPEPVSVRNSNTASTEDLLDFSYVEESKPQKQNGIPSGDFFSEFGL